MVENSKIEWCDHTFNPWMGCTKVSPACKHCYAERDMDHRLGVVAWGPNGNRVVTSELNWKKPLKWNRDAEKHGVRFRVFCSSLADVFEDWQGPIVNNKGETLYRFPASRLEWGTPDQGTGDDELTMQDIRNRLEKLIDATPYLDWLLLTKRPENIPTFWFDPDSLDGFPCRKNVWLGTSVENQEQAEKRIPELLKCRDLSPVLFLSCEPLLSRVDLTKWIGYTEKFWVIAGGESGPGSRPTDPEAFRSLRDQCIAAGVPFLLKQHGEWCAFTDIQLDNLKVELERLPVQTIGVHSVHRVGKKAAGRLIDGHEWNQFPEVVE